MKTTNESRIPFSILISIFGTSSQPIPRHTINKVYFIILRTPQTIHHLISTIIILSDSLHPHWLHQSHLRFQPLQQFPKFRSRIAPSLILRYKMNHITFDRRKHIVDPREEWVSVYWAVLGVVEEIKFIAATIGIGEHSRSVGFEEEACVYWQFGLEVVTGVYLFVFKRNKF